jgi:hypothetical protein
MITLDRSAINVDKRESPLWGGLEDFAHQVSMLKPLCDFKVDDDCLKTEYSYKDETDEQGNTRSKQTRTTTIYKIKVFQEGEELGAVSMSERYHQGKKESVYGVHSFRINKERGDREATLTKNLKVALRTIKKVLVSRADNELITLLWDKVDTHLSSLVNQSRSYVQYSTDPSNEVLNLAMLAYQARLKGEATITVPSVLKSVKDSKNHDKNCENFTTSSFLHEQLKSNAGYAVKSYPNSSFVVLRLVDRAIKKYASFDLLPTDIQGKLGMFKVIAIDEPYAHLGCKFSDDIYYISVGELATVDT